MKGFPLYFNELSVNNCLSAKRIPPIDVREKIICFINTLREIKLKRPDLELHNSKILTKYDFGGGAHLGSILNSGNYQDHWRFVKLLVQKAPWDIQNLEQIVLWNGQPAWGFSLALRNDSAVISLLFTQSWKDSEIAVLESGTEKVVRNFSSFIHVHHHKDLISNFGVNVSPSSLIFKGDFQVRMYLNDHNPPHVHVEYSDYKAKIDIHNTDTLQGSLPPQIVKKVKSWINNNRSTLLNSWDRCFKGNHPELIVS